MCYYYKKCPKCNQRKNVYMISYGYTGSNDETKVEKRSIFKRRIVPGGCTIFDEKWFCMDCKLEFK